jgi:HAD superfamily hydrolase (TIGR01484 family)
MIRPYQELLDVDYPVVACNGALVWQGGLPLSHHPMNAAALAPLLRDARDLGMTILYSMLDSEYCHEETAHSRRRRQEKADYPTIQPLNFDAPTLNLDKITILDDEGRCPALECSAVRLRRQYNITYYNRFGMEIVAGGVSKASGMEEIARILGIGLDEILAIGDSENDNEMLRRAGLAVVVANGAEKTKAIADYVCAREAGAGLAEAIEMFCLK